MELKAINGFIASTTDALLPRMHNEADITSTEGVKCKENLKPSKCSMVDFLRGQYKMLLLGVILIIVIITFMKNLLTDIIKDENLTAKITSFYKNLKNCNKEQ
jgi:hypothetical protein